MIFFTAYDMCVSDLASPAEGRMIVCVLLVCVPSRYFIAFIMHIDYLNRCSPYSIETFIVVPAFVNRRQLRIQLVLVEVT